MKATSGCTNNLIINIENITNKIKRKKHCILILITIYINKKNVVNIWKKIVWVAFHENNKKYIYIYTFKKVYYNLLTLKHKQCY